MNYMTSMGKARKKKNQQEWFFKRDYIKTSNEDMWAVIENDMNITDIVPDYRDGGETKLYVNVDENEEIYYLGVPFDNYAITSFGRVWSFKTKKFIKAFYRPNSVIFYMNSNKNVTLKALYKKANWHYNHSKVCERLLNYNLLVNDYKNGETKSN